VQPPKSPPLKPAPPPLQVDTARVVLAGTALWAVALVVLLVLGDRVDRVWTWTCVAGIGLAVLGLGVMRLQGQLGRPADQSVRTSKSEVS
jgi:Protein of unknown function (DUF2530)